MLDHCLLMIIKILKKYLINYETKNIFNGALAVDFGDLSVARTAAHAASNGHGGLKLTS